MPQPILYLAITNHGFGHATRAASVAAEIQRRCPDVLLILVTTAPRWLLEGYIEGDFIVRPRAFDIGVIQQDSIQMDKAATLEKLQELQAKQRSIIASEVSFIQQNRVGLVLADIPPMAALIAKAAGIPGYMMSNFGWDFIYRDWGSEFVDVADWIADCFGQCDRLFRLPLHEPMSAFPHITDVGFTGGTPRYRIDQLRQDLNLQTPPAQTVLLTFGGLGLEQIPYQNLARFPDWTFLTFDKNAPNLPNLLKLSSPQYRPVDVMPICKCVVSKPGYSTFAEACRQNLPIVSITREDFAEAAVLLRATQDYVPTRILQPSEFFGGDWDFLTESFQPPNQSDAPRTDGNVEIAEAVLNTLQTA
ncbi:MAG: glycosyl transferase [Leptolyngbyaceae cyanobacterium bins.302]|nr:glycosyl transferase [Leptolyngbyaceae cyanobacterium bins.302]